MFLSAAGKLGQKREGEGQVKGETQSQEEDN